MNLKENVTFWSIIVFVVLISSKLWIKLNFEIQLIGLIILIAISWTLKFFIIKKIKRRIESKKAEREKQK